MVRLAVAHPSWTARREHRELLAPGHLETLQELASLLHDGEIGREVRIKDVVEAEHPQRRHEAIDRGLLARQTEGLTPGRTHGGSHLHHDDLVGVGESVKDTLGVIALAKRTSGAVRDALAAEGAVGLLDGYAALTPTLRWLERVGEVPTRPWPETFSHTWMQRSS